MYIVKEEANENQGDSNQNSRTNLNNISRIDYFNEYSTSGCGGGGVGVPTTHPLHKRVNHI